MGVWDKVFQMIEISRVVATKQQEESRLEDE